MCFTRRSLEATGPLDATFDILDDLDLVLRVTLRFRAVFLDRAAFTYHVHADGVARDREKVRAESIRLAEKLVREHPEVLPVLGSAAFARRQARRYGRLASMRLAAGDLDGARAALACGRRGCGGRRSARTIAPFCGSSGGSSPPAATAGCWPCRHACATRWPAITAYRASGSRSSTTASTSSASTPPSARSSAPPCGASSASRTGRASAWRSAPGSGARASTCCSGSGGPPRRRTPSWHWWAATSGSAPTAARRAGSPAAWP